MSGELAILDYAYNQNNLWKIESTCNETHIFSTVFDTRANVDFVTIESAKYSGVLTLDLVVPNSFYVGFSSGGGELAKPGVVLLWECRNDAFDSKCCSDIEASGFTRNEMNGIYSFSGNFLNGRHLYVDQNSVFGIWFDGEYGDAADWVLGLMSNIAEGKLTYGWVMSNQDTSCPSWTKVWTEWWNSQWIIAERGIIKCLSGYYYFFQDNMFIFVINI